MRGERRHLPCVQANVAFTLLRRLLFVFARVMGDMAPGAIITKTIVLFAHQLQRSDMAES